MMTEVVSMQYHDAQTQRLATTVQMPQMTTVLALMQMLAMTATATAW